MSISHPEMVKKLVKSGYAIRIYMTDKQASLIHATMGISGEAGELLDAIKKHVIYHKDLDRENIVEELGDLEFYMEALKQELDITRAETIAANIDKLSVRYENFNYTNEAAINRLDKQNDT